MMIVVFTI